MYKKVFWAIASKGRRRTYRGATSRSERRIEPVHREACQLRASGQLRSVRWRYMRPERPLGGSALLAQAKSCHNLAIPIRVATVQIVQQPATLIDHHDQPATRSMIFCVGLEMGREVVDALAQQRDLHFWRSGVFRMNPILLDYTGFGFHQPIPPLKRRAPALCSSPLRHENASTEPICRKGILRRARARPAAYFSPRTSERNSSRVCLLSRKTPSIALVTAAECCFSTPRITMHRWRASMITPTP